MKTHKTADTLLSLCADLTSAANYYNEHMKEPDLRLDSSMEAMLECAERIVIEVNAIMKYNFRPFRLPEGEVTTRSADWMDI